nr:MAG TPA: hypothetical protein [Caudoviricetes sp.]
MYKKLGRSQNEISRMWQMTLIVIQMNPFLRQGVHFV